MVKLIGSSPYLAKDQAKANLANKFIGRGSARSSTNTYAACFGAMTNCGTYAKDDVVFVSAEGARAGRLSPDLDELRKAAVAGVMFVTDNAYNRERPYNLGERQVAAFLTANGYVEVEPGRWLPKA